MKIRQALYGFAGILLLLLLVILLPIDDKLDAEAAAWVQAGNDVQDVAGNGYYYLMGIMAAPDEDPAIAGKTLIDDYRATERKFLDGEIAEFPQQGYPADKALAMPAGDYYCRIQDPGCFTRLAASTGNLRQELQNHGVLLQRYQRYLQFDAMKFLVEPALYEQFPPYQHVVRGNKLHQFRILTEHAAGNRERALSMLHEDITGLRRRLADESSLLGKMVTLAMLADDMDLLFNLAQGSTAPRPVPALAPEERSLQSVMVREFSYTPNLFRQMEHQPRSLGGDFHTYDWLIRATLKPNMSINNLLPYYRAIAELSLADAAEFKRVVAENLPGVNNEFNPRNIGGYILNSIAAPELAAYIARLHNVDCKIALINAALPLDAAAWTQILNGGELAAVNPYGPEEKPYVNESQAVCFNGPFPDEQMRRCIRKDLPL